MVGNVETSRAKPSSAFQDNATNGPTADQAQGSLQTCEELQYSFKDFDEFKNKVFAKDNNKVNVLQFPNLEEAIKIASTIVPDYLQHIAGKIQIDRGTCTEFELINIQLLVCAAIKEMEDLPLQQLNLSTFLKWGATFNRAKELGFQVKFADTLLKNNLGIFFGYQRPS
ncbi:uncharacterized protein LOC111296850 [Durio zibethinus]|uniref:Uncharacterized protein LOC111296850 n=1 Tax=Durio zibethinus TaxID=66656 RepID=A0A6P5Z3B7_DURZI|nr:uncharacterized protein LOC111296850 [Durio zibethinus]